jgi:hypothetical protein
MMRPSIITLNIAVILACLSGCGDTHVHDSYIEIAPAKTNAAPPDQPAAGKDALAPKVFAVPTEQSTALPIKFDDLNLNLEIDAAFKPEKLTDRVKELAGQRIHIAGVMSGAIAKPKGNAKFILLRNKEMRIGPGGGYADQLIMVEMQPPGTIDFTTETVQVAGILRIKPETGADGNLWSLYILEEATARKLP